MTPTSCETNVFCRLHEIQHLKIDIEHNFNTQLDIALVVVIQKTSFFIVCNKLVQGKPETFGHHRQAVNLAPFKQVYYRLFRPTTGPTNISEGACPNYR